MGYKRTTVDYRTIAETYYNRSVSGMHVHHIDGNSHNNDPKNLFICAAEEHAQLHRDMGQEQIALLLEGQVPKGTDWFSVIGKLGSEKSKGVLRSGYSVSEKAYKQRCYARSCKGNQKETKLSLQGESRTNKQKQGSVKAVESKKSREMTELERKQLNDFCKKGLEAAKLALIGSKKFIHPITGKTKFAKPNSDKWFQLLKENYITI